MNEKSVSAYVAGFGRRLLGAEVVTRFPETRIIPQYLRDHFPGARSVLDLGFGTGVWFWSSFLPSLERVDGFDLYQEALDEADRVLGLPEPPPGYRAAHEWIGSQMTSADLARLRRVRGHLVIGDYLEPWPDVIRERRYDLITEYGGIGELPSDDDFVEIVQRAASVLSDGGSMIFVNFLERTVPDLERDLGRYTPDGLNLSTALFDRAVAAAGMVMEDFNAVDDPDGMPTMQTFFCGYATKSS